MLKIENLSAEYYRRDKTIRALDNVSMEVLAGETLGVVGESGSGKSTIALSILRLIRPGEGKITGGKILFQGADLLALAEPEMRKVRGSQIGMVFQDPFTALNPVLRIRDQMAEMPHPAGGTWSLSALGEALEQVKLEPPRVLSSYPHQLSGGQRQRVLIAMALLPQPKLLLADEPTTALDVIVQKEILELLFDLQRRSKVSMILISHNIAVVAQFTQNIVVLKKGKVVEQGPTLTLLKDPHQPYTRELLEAVPRL